MPSLTRGVLFLLLVATVLPFRSSAATLDAEERQKEEKAHESARSDVSKGTAVRAPDPPQNLRVIYQTATVVMLEWGAPSDTSEFDHYFVYVEGEDMQADTTEIIHIFEDLTPCMNYTFGVSSVSATNDMSDPALCQTETDAVAPPEPQNLSADKRTSTTVTLTWEPPDTSCPIEEYRVMWQGGSSAVNEVSYTVTGLSTGTTYTFNVFASTSNGEGPPASVQQTTALNDQGPPEDLVAVGVSTSAINASWSPPSGDQPVYYVLTAPPCLYLEELIGGLSYLITGLDPCQTCNVIVKTHYNDNNEYTAQTTGSSLGEIPPPPSSCSVTADGFTVTVTWNSPNTDCDLGPYSVNWTATKLWGKGEQESGSENVTPLIFSIPSPVPYTQYAFSISASIDGVFGSPVSCSGTSPETLPGAPQNLTVDSVQGAALVTWETPIEENGLIAKYGIFVDEETSPQLEVSGDTHSASLTNLKPCTSVGISVKAYNGAGWGTRSEVKDVTYVDDVLPEAVNCTAADLSVEVCWTPSSAECPVSQYNLEWEGDVLWSEDIVDSSSTTIEWSDSEICYNISALPFTKYVVDLTVGTKPEVISCTGTTPMAAPGPPADMSLGVDEFKVNVTWTEPDKKNGIIEMYKVVWRDSSSELGSHATEDNSTFSYQILGLSCGKPIDVTVRAKVQSVEEFGEEFPAQTAYLVNSVENLHCESSVPGQVSLNWTLVDEECEVTLYNLTWTYSSLWSNNTGEGWQSEGDEDASATLESLPPYADVFVQVHVYNNPEYKGCSAVTPDEVPGPPKNLIVDSAQGEVLVAWETPTEENGIIGKYGIFVNEETEPELVVSGDTHIASVKTLEPCVRVGISVKARNRAGWGTRSEVKDVTVEDDGCKL